MAKKVEENEELIVDVQEVYSKTETFIENNKNILLIVVGAAILLIGGISVYNNFYLAPLEEEAQEEMFMAEKYFAKDSFNLAINGDGVYYGFLDIVDNYGSTAPGNLAHYYLGISFLRTGQYEAAIEELENFSIEDEVIQTMAIGAIGDAYMELGDLNKAASHYKKAANRKENDFTTPLFLLKAGNTYELVGEYKNALDAYERIKKEYKTTNEGSQIEKYIARAEAFVQ